MSRLHFRALAPGLVGLGLLLLVGCQNYTGQLNRAQRYYEESKYEYALAVFRNLEPEQHLLTPRERVRYCYLRGMSDLRLGYRDHARYWLGLARSASQHFAGSLLPAEEARLTEFLDELNRAHYAAVQAELSGAPAKAAAPAKCSWSSDCEDGQVCQEGACQRPQ